MVVQCHLLCSRAPRRSGWVYLQPNMGSSARYACHGFFYLATGRLWVSSLFTRHCLPHSLAELPLATTVTTHTGHSARLSPSALCWQFWGHQRSRDPSGCAIHLFV